MKHTAIALFVLVLFIPVVTVYPVSSQTQPSYVNAYIQEDGTVHGTNNIQRNGNYYTFTGDVTGALLVEKDNIVIDGSGYTLASSRARGIILENRTGVTVKNTRITLNGGYVIDLRQAVNCTIVGNTLVGTPQPEPNLPPPTRLIGPIGINLLNAQNIIIKNNIITNFSTAVALDWSNGHVITDNTLIDGISGFGFMNTTNSFFRNNHLVNCDFSIYAYPTYQYFNDLDTSNSIDGKPIVYWVNQKDKTVPADAAYIVLVGCQNLIVENLQTEGISVLSTTNITISKVTLTSGTHGIDLSDSSNIKILDCVIDDQAIGISLHNSSNNLIKGNTISNHCTRGINLNNASNNIIAQNQIINNSYAIGPYYDMPSKGNLVILNTFRENDYAITLQGHMQIIGNLFESNNQAIMVSGTGGTITQNTFVNNSEALYFGGSSDNLIYLNNFLQNERQMSDGGANSTYTYPQSGTNSPYFTKTVVHVEKVNFMPPPPISINKWDNGFRGNYWIDYPGSDENGDGIGDTAYFLYENNQDNYPLMNQVQAPTLAEVLTAFQLSLPSGADQPSENHVDEGLEVPVEYLAGAVAVTVGLVAAGLLAVRIRSTKTVVNR
ncbi:MAG: nitrous oxide reductase family maturation protein NosD [Candidatus Bathyarchaeia archaeon]|jgi:parallel beta-helix repeat protein